YDPWGLQLSGPSLEMAFLGAQQRRSDPTSGLLQMGERSYGPALGGFLSEDPVLGHLGIGMSTDRYLYVRDNPLNRHDLDGRDVCVFDACAGEAAEDVGSAARGAAESAWGAGKSGAEWGWNQTDPTRRWLADRANDFFKTVKSSLPSIDPWPFGDEPC